MPGDTDATSLSNAVQQEREDLMQAHSTLDAAQKSGDVKWIANAQIVVDQITLKLAVNEANLAIIEGGGTLPPASQSFGNTAFWTATGYSFIP